MPQPGPFTIRIPASREEYELAQSVRRAGSAGSVGAAFRQHLEREAERPGRSLAPFLIVGSGPLFPPLAAMIQGLTQWERDQLWIVDLEHRSPVADAHFGGGPLTVDGATIAPRLSLDGFRMREEIADADAVIFVGEAGSHSHLAAEEGVAAIARRVGRPLVSLLYTTWFTELPTWPDATRPADHVRIFLEEPGAREPRERSCATRAAIAILRVLLIDRPRRAALPYWLKGEARAWIATIGETRSGRDVVAIERAIKRSPPGSERVLLLPDPVWSEARWYFSDDADGPPPYPAIYYGERPSPREVVAILLTRIG